MGLIHDEYWKLTPVEEQVLVAVWRNKENRSHLGTAQLTALFLNFFSGAGARTYSPEEFLPFKLPSRYLTIEEAEVMASVVFGIKDDDGKQ